jgi:hypothetical protein
VRCVPADDRCKQLGSILLDCCNEPRSRLFTIRVNGQSGYHMLGRLERLYLSA